MSWGHVREWLLRSWDVQERTLPVCGSLPTFTPCPAGHRVRDRRSQGQMGPARGLSFWVFSDHFPPILDSAPGASDEALAPALRVRATSFQILCRSCAAPHRCPIAWALLFLLLGDEAQLADTAICPRGSLSVSSRAQV